jgi:ribosomal protein S27AE
LLNRPAVKFEWLTRRAREIVADTIADEGEPELERLLVAGAVVVREGEHYRIESGEDVWSDLEARARRLEGLCECGSLLSSHGSRAHCRRCGREYRKI